MKCLSWSARALPSPLSLALLLSAASAGSSSASTTVPYAGSALLAADSPTTPMCQVNGQVRDVVFTAGYWFLAGEFDLVRHHGTAPGDASEVTRRGLAQCDAAGEVTTWDAGLAHTDAALTDVRQVALSADQSVLYVAGKFHTSGASGRRHAAAFDLTGSGLATATLNGWNPHLSSRANTVLPSPDGARVYVGGGFQQINTGPAIAQALLAATDPVDGTLIATFAPTIDTSDPNVYEVVLDLAFSADGTELFVGGVFFSVNSVARSSAASVDVATGQTTSGFAPDLEDTNPNDPLVQIYEIQVLGSQVYLCGDWWVTEGIGDSVDQRNVGRFDPGTGVADRSFWVATDGGIQACDLDPVAGLLYVGGHFDVVDGSTIRDLFALRLDGGGLAPWYPGTTGIPGVWAVRVATGQLVVGGTFTQAGGDDAENIAAFPLSRSATMVVGDVDPALIHDGDTWVRRRLEDPHGFEVTLLEDDVAVGDELDGQQVGIISGTASSTVLGGRFTDAEAPLLLWKPYILDDMQLTGPTPGVDHELTTIDEIDIVDAGHPLAAGLTGTVQLLDQETTTTWGEPAPGARIVARAETGESNLWTYLPGGALDDGSPAANCRTGFPIYRTANTRLTPAGLELFDRAVSWTTAICPQTLFVEGFESGSLSHWD